MPAYERDHSTPQRNAVQRSAHSAVAPVPPLLALQRKAGNAAVTRTVEVQRRVEQQSHEHGAGCGHDDPVQASTVYDVIKKPGVPVDPAIRAKAEQGMGVYLGDVEVHKDAAARQSAADLQAHAYTTDRHIVVGEGGDNEHTMLHELAHVKQQRKGSVPGTDNGGGLSLSDKGDPKEVEAEDWAHRLKGGPDPVPYNDEPLSDDPDGF
ncbi:DUF4157 domain-containing protein [Streptomyces sp. NBC_01500]|uniref:eCIS core domain-containing protein n=1 Tax=Streptomyces sp. NBC_01500 TaxID=2903886 RepID=UPI00225844F4|nr:DUF4157 domain-containing protein [Streptomyces sp. NBC_01500]MCX4549390.1 DUF4157 domain-containing protein [Streptomyces sp. NBC_01500]